MSNPNLRHEREQRGWSQARVAEQIGTDPGTISRWERGFSSPSPYFRERLCQLYGKTAEELGLLVKEQTDAAPLEQATPDVKELERSDSFAGILQSENDSEEALSPRVSGRSRLLACLSILFGWFSGFLVLLLYRSNRFVNFYSIQSVCFFGIANIIIWVSGVYARPRFEDASVFRFLLNFGGSVTAMIALLVWIFAMVQAGRGKYYRFPLIGNYCDRMATTLASSK